MNRRARCSSSQSRSPELETFPSRRRRSDAGCAPSSSGETELRSDPGFQAALRRVTTRTGISMGLDAADQAIGKLEATPAGARAVPELRRKLAAARRSVGVGR